MGLELVVALGQVVEIDQLLVEPALVGVGRGQLGLHLVVVHDAPLGRVDQEHAPRLQATLLHHHLGLDRDHPDLGGHDDQVVAGDPVARGPQTVAIEDRTDDRSVGEGDRGRAVPRLHERGVVAVEGLLGLGHQLVVLPRLWDHHQHGVGQRVAPQVQQLEHLVEGGRVARARGADGEDALEVAGERVGPEQRLAGPHPVAVALHRVDLAVVGHVAERMGQRPRRERVGREPRVHERHGRFDPRVDQVGEEVGQLRRGEHALVDQRAAREAREVDAALCAGRTHLVLDPLAHDVDPPLERLVDQAVAGQEHLAEGRFDRLGGGTDPGVVDGHLAPAQDAQTLAGRDLLDGVRGLVGLDRICGQEGDARGVGTFGRQREADHLAQEAVGDLHQDAGAVAGVDLAARGSAVLEGAQRADALLDDVVAAQALHVHDEADPAGVVLLRRRVEALGAGSRWV